MDKRDVALHASFPTVMVPQFSPLMPSEAPGERLLVASNGVFLEITRKWARFVRRVGDFSVPTPVPYGACHESTEWLADELPLALLEEFNGWARQHSTVEIGAGIVWNDRTRQYRLLPCETLSASGSHLKYRPPPMAEGDHLIVDCHSHAAHDAFFSGIDDADDRWSVKIAYVVGRCGENVQSTKTRLCLKGAFEEIQLI